MSTQDDIRLLFKAIKPIPTSRLMDVHGYYKQQYMLKAMAVVEQYSGPVSDSPEANAMQKLLASMCDVKDYNSVEKSLAAFVDQKRAERAAGSVSDASSTSASEAGLESPTLGR